MVPSFDRGRRKMRRRLLAAALALPIAVLTGPAKAQYCDNLDGKDVTVTGVVDKAVEAAGVVFFRDSKTGCQFGIVMHRDDKPCKTGSQISVSGKLIKNKFMADTYDVDRGSKPPPETLMCK
jgi:hypothetical protein